MSKSNTADLVERAINRDKQIAALLEEFKATLAPPGSLGLPELLEQRRLEFGIPNGCFRIQAAFERVLIYDIAPFEQASISSGSGLIIPDSTAERLKSASPRGIIVSAGAAALDALRTNGMDLGHIVLYTHYLVGRTPVQFIGGKEMYVMIAKAGDVSGSEDTAQLMRDGKLRIGWNEDTKQHYFIWGQSTESNPAPPVMPWVTADI